MTFTRRAPADPTPVISHLALSPHPTSWLSDVIYFLTAAFPQVPGTAARWRARRHDVTTLPALNDYHRDKVVKHLEARAHPESGRTTRCSAHLDRSDVIILRERRSPDDYSTTWHVLLLPTDGNGTKGAETRAAELQALRTPCLYPLPGRALGPHIPYPCRSHAYDTPLGAQPSPNLMAERCDVSPHRSLPTGTESSCTMEGQTP